MSATPGPFRLAVDDAAIADLRGRLGHTRFPDQAPGEPWAYGTDLDYLRGLVAYWRDGFDWRAQEAALNAFPQYKLRLGGIDVHFLHVPGNGPAPCPLLLLHGWPGSVFEFLDLILRLADPARFGGNAVVQAVPRFARFPVFGRRRLGVRQHPFHHGRDLAHLLRAHAQRGQDRFRAGIRGLRPARGDGALAAPRLPEGQHLRHAGAIKLHPLAAKSHQRGLGVDQLGELGLADRLVLLLQVVPGAEGPARSGQDARAHVVGPCLAARLAELLELEYTEI